MTPDETTRIEFAERQGWKRHLADAGVWVDSFGNRRRECEAPNPTDHNHVHAALMGMSEVEWTIFAEALLVNSGHDEDYYEGWSIHAPAAVEFTLKAPLPTLVSCFLEATKGRVKS
jgi:hypothetical protein